MPYRAFRRRGVFLFRLPPRHPPHSRAKEEAHERKAMEAGVHAEAEAEGWGRARWSLPFGEG